MMKKINRVLREILYRAYEQNQPFMSQKSLAQACETSMDTVNRLVSKLHQFSSIEKKPLGFKVTNPKKVLLYWASTRNLTNDIVYSTYSSEQTSKIEAEMPPGTIFTGYSGYQLRFKDMPTHYEDVYVYTDPDEVKRRFPEKVIERKNVFVLRPDPHLNKVSRGNAAPLAQIYVDLWQIGGATAERFMAELERRLELSPVDAIKSLSEALKAHNGSTPPTKIPKIAAMEKKNSEDFSVVLEKISLLLTQPAQLQHHKKSVRPRPS